jgi:hypothetical protein
MAIPIAYRGIAIDIRRIIMSSGASTDPQIRAELKKRILKHDANTAIVNELPLRRGIGKADIAAINGRLVGYEIKSESDSLARLENQIPLYDSVFERVFIVVAPKHAEKASSLIPAHWGVIVAAADAGEITLRETRPSRLNPNIDTTAVTMLLWGTEVAKALRVNQVAVPRNKLIAHMWAAMLNGLTRTQIIAAARHALKARCGIASAAPQIQDGD